MTPDEAKQHLLRYRPDLTAAEKANDAELAEALALAKQDPALGRWLEEYSARQESLQAKFRQIKPPPGLREQIISEHQALMRMRARRRFIAVAAALTILLCAGIAILWQKPSPENDLAQYRNRMIRVALSPYAMDLETNDLAQIHAYLAQQQAPSDYVLPAGLRNVAVTGCAVEKWQDKKVAMVCFRTGKPLPPGTKSDLWLFVVDRSSVGDAPAPGSPVLANVNVLITATWSEGNKMYLLGVAGDEHTIRSYLQLPAVHAHV